jgi:hypothetical protein
MMKQTNLFFLIAVILSIFCVAAVQADDPNTLTATISGQNQGYISSITNNPVGSANFTHLNISAQNIQNFGGLNSIVTSTSLMAFSAWNIGNFVSWSSPVNVITPSGVNISTGTLSYSFISNTSPTLGVFQVTYIPSTMNVTSQTGSVSNLMFTGATYPSVWLSNMAMNYFSTNFNPVLPSTQSFMWLSSTDGGLGGGSYPLGYVSTIIPSQACSWTYNFKNIASITPGVNQYNISIQKQGFAPGINGYSAIWLSDGTGNILTKSLSSQNIQYTSFAAPIAISIQDQNTGQCWTKSFYTPVFNISVSPTSNPVNTLFYAAVSGSFGSWSNDINNIQFLDSNNGLGTSNQLYDRNTTISHVLSFSKISGVWYQWDGAGYNIATTLPTNVQFTIPVGGNYSVWSTYSSSIGYSGTTNSVYLTVTGNPYTVNEYPTDYATGGIISGSTVSINNRNTNTWINKTIFQPSDSTFSLTGGYYNIYGNAPGYAQGTNGFEYISSNISENIIMYPNSISTANSTLYVTVKNSGGVSVSGATVQVTPSNAIAKTSSSGTANFALLINSTQYLVTASATGYLPVSQYVTMPTTGGSTFLSLTMTVGTVAPTVLPTTLFPGQTGITPYPTVNGTVTNQTNPIFGNAIDWLYAMGGKPSEVGLMMAFILILLGAVCGSAASSVGLGYQYQPDTLGAMAGAMLGFIASVAFGFFQPWLAVAAVIIICFVIAKKMWG